MKAIKKFMILCSVMLSAAMLLSACGGNDTLSSSIEQSDSSYDSTSSKTEPSSDDDSADTKNTSNDILDNDENYFVLIDGKKFGAGDSISDLLTTGYKPVDNEDEISPKQNESCGMSMPGDVISQFFITVYNTTDSSIKKTEALIGGFAIRSQTATDEKAVNAEVYGGIKLGSTTDEVKKVFGEPSKILESDESTTYAYRSAVSDRNYKFRFDKDNKAIKIEWKNLVLDK